MTDHRVQYSVHSIEQMMDGAVLDEFIDELWQNYIVRATGGGGGSSSAASHNDD